MPTVLETLDLSGGNVSASANPGAFVGQGWYDIKGNTASLSSNKLVMTYASFDPGHTHLYRAPASPGKEVGIEVRLPAYASPAEVVLGIRLFDVYGDHTNLKGYQVSFSYAGVEFRRFGSGQVLPYDPSTFAFLHAPVVTGDVTIANGPIRLMLLVTSDAGNTVTTLKAYVFEYADDGALLGSVTATTALSGESAPYQYAGVNGDDPSNGDLMYGAPGVSLAGVSVGIAATTWEADRVRVLSGGTLELDAGTLEIDELTETTISVNAVGVGGGQSPYTYELIGGPDAADVNDAVVLASDDALPLSYTPGTDDLQYLAIRVTDANDDEDTTPPRVFSRLKAPVSVAILGDSLWAGSYSSTNLATGDAKQGSTIVYGPGDTLTFTDPCTRLAVHLGHMLPQREITVYDMAIGGTTLNDYYTVANGPSRNVAGDMNGADPVGGSVEGEYPWDVIVRSVPSDVQYFVVRNDANDGSTTAQLLAKFSLIIAQIQADFPSAKIILQSDPIPIDPAGTGSLVRKQELDGPSGLATLANGSTIYFFDDLFSPWLSQHPEGFYAIGGDTVHFNDKGYDAMAMAFAKQFADEFYTEGGGGGGGSGGGILSMG